jgi:PKD repeat protein
MHPFQPAFEPLEDRTLPSVTIYSIQTPSYVREGEALPFSAEAHDFEEGPITYTWDFDDGTVLSGVDLANPSHTYAVPGIYLPKLMVTDQDGHTAEEVVAVTVQAAGALFVRIEPFAQTVTVNSPVSLTGSYDDPNGTVAPEGIAWDFDYNGQDFFPTTTGTLTPAHVYTAPGEYQVALQITDDQGLRQLALAGVVVRDYQGPTVEAGADLTITAGATAAFSGAYTDPDGTVAPADIAWDFDYRDDTFTPDVTGTLTPNWTYPTPGVYCVALRVTDNHGLSDTGFLHVTVNHAAPYVDAGLDRELAAGEAADFFGYYVMAGSVDPANVNWDFDYDGITFDPDTAATSTLSPSHQFNSPGVYQVALRVTDSNQVTVIDTLQVIVTNARPLVEVGPDLTITQGQVAAFSVSVTCADPVEIEWDFEYGETFDSDPSAYGQLTPSHTYLAAGTYVAAVRVTNTVGGAASLRTVVVTVESVPPSAVVSHSGPVPEGTPVTFTIRDWSDVNPAAEFDFLVDWTGNGDFERVPDSRRTVNPADGSISFSHAYADNGTYPVTVRILDYEGGYTDYPLTVTVNNAAPTAVFGPNSNSSTIGAGVPFQFKQISDPSYMDHAAGFTYFYSVNGGAYLSSASPKFYLPDYVPNTQYTVRAYLQDKDGGTSPVYETSVFVVPTQTFIVNHGTGYVGLTWGGNTVELGPNQFYVGVGSDLTVTLRTAGASYDLQTNAGIQHINALPGVADVQLTVRTDWIDLSGASLALGSPEPTYGPAFLGDGDVGVIELPGGSAAGGGSLLTVVARGDLASVAGPGGAGRLWARAGYLAFDNLTGSITGLDRIDDLSARGWVGDDPAEDVVWANLGISMLTAYGVRARVIADQFFLSSDAPVVASIGAGGAAARFHADRISSFTSQGVVTGLQAHAALGPIEIVYAGGVARTTKATPSEVRKIVSHLSNIVHPGANGVLGGTDRDARESRALGLSRYIHSGEVLREFKAIPWHVIETSVGAFSSMRWTVMKFFGKKAWNDIKAMIEREEIEVYQVTYRNGGNEVTMTLFWRRKPGDFIAVYSGKVYSTVRNNKLTQEGTLETFAFSVKGRTYYKPRESLPGSSFEVTTSNDALRWINPK